MKSWKPWELFVLGMIAGGLIVILLANRYSYHTGPQAILYRSDRLPPWHTEITHGGSAWHEVP